MSRQDEFFYFSAIPYSRENVKDLLLAGVVNPRLNTILFEGDLPIIKTLAYSLVGLMPNAEVIEGCPLKCSLGNRAALCQDCSAKYYGNRSFRVGFVEPEVFVFNARKSADELNAFIGNLRAFRGIVLLERISTLDQGILRHLFSHPLLAAAPLTEARFKLIALRDDEDPPLEESLKNQFGLVFNQYALGREVEDEELLNRMKAFDTEREKFQEVWQGENEGIINAVNHAKDAIGQVYIPLDVQVEAKKIINKRPRDIEYPDRVFTEVVSALCAIRKQPSATIDLYEQAAMIIYPEKTESRKKKKPAVDLRATVSLKGISTLVRKKGAVQVLMEEELERQKAKAAPETRVEAPVSQRSEERILRPPEEKKVAWEKIAEKAAMPPVREIISSREAVVEQPEVLTKEKAVAPPPPAPSKQIGGEKKKLSITMILVFDASGNSWIGQVKEIMSQVILDLNAKYIFNLSIAAFREKEAIILLPPTKEFSIAVEALHHMVIGGKAPLAEGILRGKELATDSKRLFPDDKPLVVLFTDGRANVSNSALSPSEAAKAACKELAVGNISTAVVDLEAGFLRFGFSEELARIAKGWTYHPDQLDAAHLGEYFAELLEKESKEKPIKK